MTRAYRQLAGLLLILAAAGACGTQKAGTATPMTVTVPVPMTVTVAVPVTVTLAGPPARSPDEPAPTDAPDSVGPTDDTAIPGLASEGTGVDPCALVTLVDAQKLAATKLDPGNKSGQTCTYSGPVDGPTAQVQIFVGPGAQKQLDIEKQLGHKLRPLTGVGTGSYAGESAVYVGKGGLWVSVELVRLNEPAENVGRLEQVAKTVASRM